MTDKMVSWCANQAEEPGIRGVRANPLRKRSIMRTLILSLFFLTLAGCTTEKPEDTRFTSKPLMTCHLTSGAQGIGCEEYVTCFGLEPANTKAKQVLVKAFISGDNVVCQWQSK